MAKIVSALNLKLLPRDLRSKDSRQLLSTIFNQWLSLSTCVIQTVIDIVPSPPAAQAVRLPRMLYPNVFDQEIQPKNRLEQDLYFSNSNADAYVTAYVSKMFAVPKKELPENKDRPLTAEELRMRGRAARETRKESASDDVQSIVAPEIESTADVPKAPVEASEEILLGFARLYSGTIKVGTKIYCILPKYNIALSPDLPANFNNIAAAEVEGLYVMMGRELQPVARVRAGNTFAIKGLEGKVWRNATLCSPGEAGILHDSSPQQDQECLINLGGANRMVFVMGLSFSCTQCTLKSVRSRHHLLCASRWSPRTLLTCRSWSPDFPCWHRQIHVWRLFSNKLASTSFSLPESCTWRCAFHSSSTFAPAIISTEVSQGPARAFCTSGNSSF